MTDIRGADNEAQVLAAHRNSLEAMTTDDLAVLLIACGARRDEDTWFRELIVDVLKHRKDAARVAREEGPKP